LEIVVPERKAKVRVQAIGLRGLWFEEKRQRN
jgi:hypothetical protein